MATRFAQLAGLKYSTFTGWLERYRRTKPKGPAKPVRLLKAVVALPEPSTLLVLHLPGGARVEISDEQQAELAAALVSSLAQPCRVSPGKALLRAIDQRQCPKVVVSAWAVASGLSPGQLKAAGKKQRDHRRAQLLRVLDLSECIVTLGCKGVPEGHRQGDPGG